MRLTDKFSDKPASGGEDRRSYVRPRPGAGPEVHPAGDDSVRPWEPGAATSQLPVAAPSVLSDRLAAAEAPPGPVRSAAATGSLRPVAPGPGSGGPARARPLRNPAAPASDDSWERSKRKVRDLVLADVAPQVQGMVGESLAREVRASVDRVLAREDVKVSPMQRRRFIEEVIQDTLGYGPLETLLADSTLTEIMCNAYDDIWVERAGLLEPTDVAFDNDSQYRQIIDKIVTTVGRRLDEGSPMVDARLPDGSRVNAVLPPIAIHGPILTIRRFPEEAYQVADLINFGSMTADLALILDACVRARLNIMVSGGTGTGKTTMLNALSSFIPDGERIVTIEDSAELQLNQPHVLSLEARPPNAEGSGEIRIRELVRNSLRMRPDRILVGEVRGPEALDMLQAMNTGHEGSLTTVHANSPRDAMSRLETMVLMAGFELPVKAIREQIGSALDLIVHLERQASGARVISAVTELQGLEGDVILLQDIFNWHYTPGGGGHLEPSGLRPKMLDRLAQRGIELPARLFRPTEPAAPAPAYGGGRRMRAPSPAELIERDVREREGMR
ncbi:MAG: ATPase, T2SS/T4P/T4SS family [Acidimicrobiales bacterium]